MTKMSLWTVMIGSFQRDVAKNDSHSFSLKMSLTFYHLLSRLPVLHKSAQICQVFLLSKLADLFWDKRKRDHINLMRGIIRENGPIFAHRKKCNFDQNKKKIALLVQMGRKGAGEQVRVKIAQDLSIWHRAVRHQHLKISKFTQPNRSTILPFITRNAGSLHFSLFYFGNELWKRGFTFFGLSLVKDIAEILDSQCFSIWISLDCLLNKYKDNLFKCMISTVM